MVVEMHTGVEMVRGGLGRERGKEKDRYDGSVDGGVEVLEKGKHDVNVDDVEEGLERAGVLHKVGPAYGGGGVACSAGRRAPRREHGQGREFQPRHASHRCVGSPYGTPPRIQRLSPSCTLSHI